MTQERPPLVVIDGSATDEEVAALLAVLAASSGSAADTSHAPARHTSWASRERGAGAPRRPGPTAWRSSALPS
ncbi:conserved hypothetical protein [Nostocoides japonicum T1-X7]|uniref:Acyl-CoA carboxylase subunit epsilon n=1 Tax=Nostocoides japonicum T1-X7 TaxID=1194083 RepID=A0A077M2M2_9MICO|nr:acyl-CoA carboxylase epsilon subunit [Tetrasphaera japonica]CCH79277.1 conserved hypothetical protein [Tetrasphaera japonica T1-X7]